MLIANYEREREEKWNGGGKKRKEEYGGEKKEEEEDKRSCLQSYNNVSFREFYPTTITTTTRTTQPSQIKSLNVPNAFAIAYTLPEGGIEI